MEELLILVSPKDRQTGYAPKLQVHQQGLRHRAFSIFIFDRDGRLLLQQRALGKYHSAGLWTNTCCGHPRWGERTVAAAQRRLREEMGICCKLFKVSTLLYHEPVSNQLIEHEYDHVFAGICDIDPVADLDEAHSWQWQTLSQIPAAIDAAPQTFTAWFRRIFEKYGLDGVRQWHEFALGCTPPNRENLDWQVPALHCPAPFRIDESLASEVDDRLMSWVEKTGIFADRQHKVRASGFGRFAVLCHTDTDDPDRLLLSAQCIGALFAVDDYYCDDETAGSIPALVGPRLSIALAALEPVHLTECYRMELETALNSDPVLVGLRAYMARVAEFATPSQIARVRHEIIAMFVTMTAEAAWRIRGVTPALWEYLAQRQTNSFLPCMSLIDIIGGYELPANVYSSPAVRRVTTLAASATIIANDLYSAPKECQAAVGDFNLPMLLANKQQCSIEQAMKLGAKIHDDVMRLYEAAEKELLACASPLLERYLAGVKSWVAGSLEWHRHSGRYQT
jgi:isopentenyl-diphosphate delta-isomerase type 1